MNAALAALLLTVALSGCAITTQGQVVTPLVAEEGPQLVHNPIPMAFDTVGEMMGGDDSCVHWRRDPEWVIGMVHHVVYPAIVTDQAITDHANGRCS